MTNKYIAVDLETTGFSFRKNEILEYGASTIHTNEPLSLLVKTETPPSQRILSFCHITGEMLHNRAFTPFSALCKFLQWMRQHGAENAILVGHNIQQFDLPFIFETLRRYGILEMFKFKGIVDTLQILKFDKKLKKRKLAVVYEKAHGHAFPDAHRAGADAKATLDLFLSPWFQSRYSGQIMPRDSCLQEYWQRTMRLNKWSEKLVDYGPGFKRCLICQAVVAPQFAHVHLDAS